MHYIDSILKRISTLMHFMIVKMFHLGHFSFKGISVVSNSTHFTINDQGCITIGKILGSAEIELLLKRKNMFLNPLL